MCELKKYNLPADQKYATHVCVGLNPYLNLIDICFFNNTSKPIAVAQLVLPPHVAEDLKNRIEGVLADVKKLSKAEIGAMMTVSLNHALTLAKELNDEKINNILDEFVPKLESAVGEALSRLKIVKDEKSEKYIG